MKRVEILAPAGDFECFIAAIKAGADAVYLGGNFSARAYAKNFTEEEILRALDYAHFYNRKVYMTLNIVMKQDELDTVYDYIRPFYEAGLDGVIVQDIGLISYLRRNFPNLPVHASTQMTITDADAVRLLQDIGINRVVLARELSLDEISRINKQCDAELECFIHGALCYSYSGKCLMSSFIGGRSGNRGRCAGPCRLPYNDRYVLSCKDICTLQILPNLIEAGIASFKIEGRMKSPEYVAGVTGIYRKYVDLYYSDPKGYKVNKADYETLLSLYTRSGNCEGYYYNKNGRSMISIDKPGYLRADEELSRQTYERFTSVDLRKPVDFDFYMKNGTEISLIASADGYSASVVSDIATPAINRPTLKEDIIKQLNKLGNTEFKPGSCNIDMDEGLFVPIGKLNELRRNVLDILYAEIIKKYRREAPEKAVTSGKDRDITTDRIRIHAYVNDLKQAAAALDTGLIDMLSIKFTALLDKENSIDELFESYSKNWPEVYIVLPSVARNDFAERYAKNLLRLIENEHVSGIVVDNYELLYYFNSIDYNKKIITDIHLYALNSDAVNMFKGWNASVITAPIELNKAELLHRNEKNEDIVAYGYYPLMISAQCVQNTKEGCNRSCSKNVLRDRYNKEFTAVSECSECQSIIYNSVPVCLHKDMDLLRRLEPYSLRLMFGPENESLVKSVIEGFHGLLMHDTEYIPDFEYTRGHLLRGVE